MLTLIIKEEAFTLREGVKDSSSYLEEFLFTSPLPFYYSQGDYLFCFNMAKEMNLIIQKVSVCVYPGGSRKKKRLASLGFRSSMRVAPGAIPSVPSFSILSFTSGYTKHMWNLSVLQRYKTIRIHRAMMDDVMQRLPKCSKCLDNRLSRSLLGPRKAHAEK